MHMKCGPLYKYLCEEIIMQTKICTKCNAEKSIEEFYKAKSGKYGRNSKCKTCTKAAVLEYYKKNTEICKERQLKWRTTNKEHKLKIDKEYRDTHKDEIKAYREKTKSRRSEYHKNYCYNRRQTDVDFRILSTLRSRISTAIRQDSGDKAYKTIELLGCSIKELKQHLESKFTEGMTWDNYGDWHVDHQIPCISFNLKNPEEQKKCFHYTNLQPLWAYDNLSKGTKIIQ